MSPPGRKAWPRLCFAPCLSVCVSVRNQLISGTVGPVAAKLQTHTPWMPIQNLCPTFFTWACSSATIRPIFAKHIYQHLSAITETTCTFIYSFTDVVALNDLLPVVFPTSLQHLTLWLVGEAQTLQILPPFSSILSTPPCNTTLPPLLFLLQRKSLFTPW